MSNVGQLLHDLEDKLINNWRPASLGASGTVKQCHTVLQERGGKIEWAICMAAHGSHSTEPLSVPQSFLCRPGAWHENEL